MSSLLITNIKNDLELSTKSLSKGFALLNRLLKNKKEFKVIIIFIEEARKDVGFNYWMNNKAKKTSDKKYTLYEILTALRIFIVEIQKGNNEEFHLKLKERLKNLDDVKVAITTLLKTNPSIGKIDLKSTEMTVLTKELKS